MTEEERCLLPPRRNADDDLEPNDEAVVVPDLLLQAGAASRLYYPANNNRLLRYSINVLALALFLSAEGLYYYFPFVYSNKTSVLTTEWITEVVLLPVLLSLPFSAPLHQMLGCCYHEDDDASSLSCNNSTLSSVPHRRLASLLQDHVTCRIINNFLYTVFILICIGDYCCFDLHLQQSSALLIVKVFYVPAALLNIMTIYIPFLLVTVTIRVLLNRLIEEKQQQVNAELLLSSPSAGDVGTITSASEQQQQQQEQSLPNKSILLTESYRRSIGDDLHHIAQSFFPRTLLGFVVCNIAVTVLLLPTS